MLLSVTIKGLLKRGIWTARAVWTKYFAFHKTIYLNIIQKQKVTSFSQQFQFSKRRSETLMKNGLMINGVVSRSVIWFIKFTTNIPSRDPSPIFE